MNKNKGVINLELVVVIVLLIAVVGGGLYSYNTYKNKWRESPPRQFSENENKEVKVEENNSPTKTISTALPAKYLDSQNWPPVVKTSSFAYSCKLSSGSGDVPTVTEEKTINGKKYCITSLIDAGAGSRFGEYTYMTPSTTGSGTKTVSFNLRWSSCGGYGGPGDTEYDACMNTVSTFLNKLDIMVDSIMQS